MLKTKKIVASVIIFTLTFIGIFPVPIKAATITIPDSMVDSLTSTSTNQIINSAASDASGSMGKSSVPKVEVTFNSLETSQIGGKMIATANPGFFNNGSDPSKLYFTWYLKKSGCDKKDNVSDNNTCDLDGNNKIDENDWKIAAAKIIVSSSFDQSGVNYNNFSNSQNSETAGFVAVPEIDKSKNNTNVGWRNGFLRDGNGDLYKDNGDGGDVTDCYAQATKSGRLYELRRVQSDFNNECPSGYHRACISDQKASCGVYNAGNPSYQENFPACAVSSEKSDNSDVICSVKNDTDLKNFKSTVACDNTNEISLCVQNDNSSPELSLNSEFGNITTGVLGLIVGTKLGSNIGVDDTLNNKMCTGVAKPDPSHSGFFLSNIEPLINSTDEKCSVVRDGIINGKKDSDGNTIVLANSSLEPKCNFEKSDNLCKHLFPVLPKSVKNDNGKQAVSGDGEFNLAEKKFWGADPSTESTSENGKKDEENVVGLGVNTFSWIYSIGDEVGVVVEGDSVYPTNHADSSYKRMWAFSKGTCDVLDNIEKSKTIDPLDPTKNTRGFYLDGNSGILTAEVDLNDCLEENLIDPRENDLTDGKSKLGVQMVSVPQNPINDPNGRGDTLTVSTTAYNSQDYSNLLYDWSVQISRDGSTTPTDETVWKDITTELEKIPSFSAEDAEGIDKSKLDIKLNLSEALIKKSITGTFEDTFYLKIKAKIKGTATDGSQGAEQYAIVKVRQQQNQIHVYSVAANGSGMLTMDNSSKNELCLGAGEAARCYVTKNEIIGINVPNEGDNTLANFSWRVNGVGISCNSDISSQCTIGGNKIFVPILGNEGEAVDVIAKAINTKTNEAVEISKHFVIIKPQAIINSLDGSTVWPKLLGYYKDLDGNKTPDYSGIVYEAQEGAKVNLVATFYPSNMGNQATFDWIIDGQTQYDLTNKRELSFPIEKIAGESYNVGLAIKYNVAPDNQINNLRKALLKNWGVSAEDSIEEEQNVNIEINILPGTGVSASKNTQKGFASLISHLPENLVFLFNIILTSGALLLLTGIIFAIIPETLFKEEEN
jgi:hypothetical protein